MRINTLWEWGFNKVSFLLRFLAEIFLPFILNSDTVLLANGEHNSAFARAVIGSEDYCLLTQREHHYRKV